LWGGKIDCSAKRGVGAGTEDGGQKRGRWCYLKNDTVAIAAKRLRSQKTSFGMWKERGDDTAEHFLVAKKEERGKSNSLVLGTVEHTISDRSPSSSAKGRKGKAIGSKERGKVRIHSSRDAPSHLGL